MNRGRTWTGRAMVWLSVLALGLAVAGPLLHPLISQRLINTLPAAISGAIAICTPTGLRLIDITDTGDGGGPADLAPRTICPLCLAAAVGVAVSLRMVALPAPTGVALAVAWPKPRLPPSWSHDPAPFQARGPPAAA